MSEPLVWLYAITGSPGDADGVQVSGLGGALVRIVEDAGLAALVSTVHSAAFGEKALRRNLEDLDWVSSVAQTHDAVVRAAGRNGAVIPLRLASIYASDEHVRHLLTQRRRELSEALRLVSGRTEWGVKAYVAFGEPAGSAAKAPASGLDYVRRRRAQLSAVADAERNAARQAHSVHAALASVAVAARTVLPRNTPLNQGSGQEILNGAYLVDGSRDAAFREAVQAEERRNRGLHLTLTGPWPPYSFTAFEEARP